MRNMTGWHTSPAYSTHQTSYTHTLPGGGHSSVTCATPQCDGQDFHHQPASSHVHRKGVDEVQVVPTVYILPVIGVVR